MGNNEGEIVQTVEELLAESARLREESRQLLARALQLAVKVEDLEKRTGSGDKKRTDPD